MLASAALHIFSEEGEQFLEHWKSLYGQLNRIILAIQFLYFSKPVTWILFYSWHFNLITYPFLFFSPDIFNLYLNFVSEREIIRFMLVTNWAQDKAK